MEKLSDELRRMTKKLFIMLFFILLVGCISLNVEDTDPMLEEEYFHDEWETEAEPDKEMVDLGNGYFGLYVDDEMKIYYYDQEKNEITHKKTENLYELEDE